MADRPPGPNRIMSASSDARLTERRPAIPAALLKSGVVAIARATTAEHIAAAAETIVAEGITCIEVALTTPNAVPAIASLVRRLGEHACVGAGTVLTRSQARACVDVGAQFLVAPSLVPDVVGFCVAAGVPCLPGAFTPSEVVAAWESGASAVKLFPAALGGPRYLRDLRAPLPLIPLVPTGGVRADDAAEYLGAGAVAVGVGSPLFGDALVGGGLAELAERAARFVAAIRQSRTSSDTDSSVPPALGGRG